VALVVCLTAAAAGPQTYGIVYSAIGSWAGQLVLFGCTFAFLHLCGISSGTPSTDSGFGRSTFRDGPSWRQVSDSRRGLDDQPVCRGVAPMTRQSFRSPLARALGLGVAKSGVQHWWAERVTRVALVPLCLWFAASIIAHAGSDYAVFIAWIRTPLATSCMILLLIALFHPTLGPRPAWWPRATRSRCERLADLLEHERSARAIEEAMTHLAHLVHSDRPNSFHSGRFLRGRHGSRSQAFSGVFEDPANAELAAKAHRRPFADNIICISEVNGVSRRASWLRHAVRARRKG
jgi:Succinate dehydrogenase/Fumarate reductase transmembrane subunit